METKGQFSLIISSHLLPVVTHNVSPQVLQITVEGREPALLEFEKWIDIYRQYAIWGRCFDIGLRHRKVNLKPVDVLPPLQPPSSDNNRIFTRRHITGAYKHPPPHIESDCVLVDKSCSPGENRVLLERNGELYQLQLGSRELDSSPVDGVEAKVTRFPLKVCYASLLASLPAF